MHDAVAVAEVQRCADVGDDLHRPRGCHRTVAANDVAQSVAVDVLHDDVRQRPGIGLGLAGVVDRDDRGMIERRGVLCFATETQIERGIAREIRTQHLDRDVPAEP